MAALPLLQDVAGDVQHLQHRMGLQAPLAAPIRELIASEQVSEVLLIDGRRKDRLQHAVVPSVGAPGPAFLAFGGIAQPWQIRPLLGAPSCRGGGWQCA